MSDKEHPLRDLFGGGAERNFRQERFEQFENNVVEFLAKRYRLQSDLRDLSRELAASVGEPRVTLEHFNDRYPTFPVRLTCRALPRVAEKSTVASMLRQFDKQPFVRALDKYCDELGEEAQERPCGLVFPWPHLDTYGMIVHNHDHGADALGVRLVAKGRDDAILILEAFKAFLAAVDRNYPGRRWKP